MPLKKPSEASQSPFDSDTDYVVQLFAIDEVAPDPDAPKRYTDDGREVKPANIRWSFAAWYYDSVLDSDFDGNPEEVLLNNGLTAVLRSMTSESTFFDPTGRLRNGRARELMHGLTGRVLTNEEVDQLLETESGLPEDLLGDYAIAEMTSYRDRNNQERVGLGRLRGLKPRELKTVEKKLGSGVMNEPPPVASTRQERIDDGPQPPRRAQQPRLPETNGRPAESRPVQQEGPSDPGADDPGPDIERQAANVADDDNDIPF